MAWRDSGVLAAIVGFSLRHRGVVVGLGAALLGYSLYNLTAARYDVFPEFAPPQVSMRLEAPGLSPEQVEQLVTLPVERTLGGIQDIQSMRSSSLDGLSAVTVVFRSGTNVYLARQLVSERLASMSEPLPPGVTPFISPLTSSTGTVLQMGLTSRTGDLMNLRTVADWTVKPLLLAVPGVAQVQVFGGAVKQFQIQVPPERLIQYNLSLSDLLAVAGKATGVAGAGFLENNNQRIALKTEAQSVTAEQLARTVVAYHEGANVLLSDVAKVTVDQAPPIGAASINGVPGVVLLITEQYQANTLDVTDRLDRAIADLRPQLARQSIDVNADLFRPASYIQTALYNVRTAIGIGAVLVIAVLVLFLFNVRTASISVVAIPLSLLGAVLTLEYLGYTLNIMILGGLAVAIGEVVDDAIIDVENILRRLRENRHAEHPRPAVDVVFHASLEVRGAVVYATFSVILVFLPILGLSGVAGAFFAPLGIAYILAVLMSLLVALTVTPALSAWLLGARKLPRQEPLVVRWLKAGYVRILSVLECLPWLVIVVAGVVIAIGLGSAMFLREEFLPPLREGNFIVHVTAIPGTSLPESLRLGDEISRELLKMPDVQYVSQKTGRAERGGSTRGIDSSEIDAALRMSGGRVASYSPEAVRKVLDRFPGIAYEIKTFLKERIGETLTGFSSSIVVDIFSPDLAVLDEKGRQVADILRRTRGAADVTIHSVPASPHAVIEARKDDLVRWGLTAQDILKAVQTAYQGTTVGHVYEQNRVFDVAVILGPGNREQIPGIADLPLRNAAGTYVQLGQVADIYQAPGRYEILHIGGQRVQTVTCNVAGRTATSFVAEARRKIAAEVSLPQGSYIEFAGTAQAAAQARDQLLVRAGLAGVGILILLTLALGEFRNVLLVLVNLPFALVGGVLILVLTGTLLSLGAMVGFITLFGITLRNSLMMISHYEHLVAVEGMEWGVAAARRGAAERLAPILMTALVTGLGLLPLAMSLRAAGHEIEGPMALVILGGLVTSTVLNLLVLPTLALRFGRFVKTRDDRLST